MYFKSNEEYKRLVAKYLEITLSETINNNVNEIYIILYTNHKDLINILEK